MQSLDLYACQLLQMLSLARLTLSSSNHKSGEMAVESGRLFNSAIPRKSSTATNFQEVLICFNIAFSLLCYVPPVY